MSVTDSEFIFVALIIQHAMRIPHIVICGPPSSKIFFHIISLKAEFAEKKVTKYKMCVLSFSTKFTWNIFHPKKNWARYDRKCVLVFT